MKRIKSIDTIRGFCIFMMVFIHLNEWWLTEEYYWFFIAVDFIFGHHVASGFILVSGVATVLSFQSRLLKAEISVSLTPQSVKNAYKIRALLLLIISFIFNIGGSLAIGNLAYIWSWNILQTIAFTLFLAEPFLKTSNTFRIIIGVILIFANQFILALLSPYQGQINIYGVLFYLLFNPLDQYIFLSFFGVFLIGTVVGDIIFDVFKIENENERRIAIKRRTIFPLLIVGIILMILGILFHNYKLLPLTPLLFSLRIGSLPLMIYAIGINFIAISVLFYIEDLLTINEKKKYRFFYFYSFYSFTVYFYHYFLYFLFVDHLNIYNIWIVEGLTLFLLTILIMTLYKKVGPYASLKSQISLIAFKIVNFINKKNQLNDQNRDTFHR